MLIVLCAQIVYNVIEVIYMPIFPQRLKELRKSKGLSQQKLADFLGTSKSSVNMYERGEREPGLEMVESIADFFNVDVDYLFGKSDIPNRVLVQAYNLPSIPSPSEVDPDALAIKMYKQLDSDDKAEIRGEMKQMLKADKYSGKSIAEDIVDELKKSMGKSAISTK